jgi:hypothetical protein
MLPIWGGGYMADNIPGPVPGVDDADLSAVVGQLPALPSAQADDPDRFAREVRAIAEKRAQAGWPNEAGHDVGVFVLSQYPRQVGARFGAKAILDLIATDVPILGRVFFLSRDASNGRVIDFPTSDPAEILDWLVDNALGESTVVIIYRAQKYIVARREGACGDARRDIIRDTPPTATVPELLNALEHFHRQKLLIPSLCPEGVWETGRASQYVPGPQPERTIQRHLADALNFWFRGVVKAEVEDSTDIGRIDVRLLRTDQGPLFYWAIVELKVIKSFHNAPKGSKAKSVTAADNAAAVAKGIRQAHAYCANRQAEEGLLEVYDLRKNKSSDIFAETVVQQVVATCTPAPTRHVRQAFGEAEHARTAGWV